MPASVPVQAYIMLFTVPFTVLQLVKIRGLMDVDDRTAPMREPPLVPPLAKPIAILLALVTFSAWVWTDQAEQFANSPHFIVYFLGGFAWLVFGSTLLGLQRGAMQPWLNTSMTFDRREAPRRFWMSTGWNFLLFAGMIFLSVKAFSDMKYDSCLAPLDDATVEESVAACDRMLADDDVKPNTRSHLLTGRAYALLDVDNDLALADLDQALAFDKDNGWAYRLRGYIRLTRRQFEAADADLTEGIRLQPKLANPYFDRARARASLARMDAAMADANKAIALDPKEGDHFQLRAEFERALGQSDLAARDFNEAARLRSDVGSN